MKKEEKKVTVMIGSGENALFTHVDKGKKIYSNGSYFIAGETAEENKKRWEKREAELLKEMKFEKKIPSLDFKTRLYLFLTNAKIENHIPIEKYPEKLILTLQDTQYNEVYIFKNYQEYKNFFFMYFDNIDEELINLAIYTRGSKGQVVALKGLCEQVIIKMQIQKFYAAHTKEFIDEIHSRGELTPFEIVQLYEENDWCCLEEDEKGEKWRCNFFSNDCHKCLLESAAYQFACNNSDIQKRKSKKRTNIVRN